MTDTELRSPSPASKVVIERGQVLPAVDWAELPRRHTVAIRLRTFRSAFRDPAVTVPAAILTFVFLACFIGPALFHVQGPNAGLLQSSLVHFGSSQHWLGTDNIGNDMVSRLMFGGRISLEVGIATTILGVSVGTLIGMLAGYLGGLFDGLVMRALDVMLAFPGIILALAIVTWLGASELNVIFALSFFSIPYYARLSRGQTLSTKHRDYVTAARISGARTARVIRQHIFRNVLPTLLTVSMLTVGTVMLAEAGLSYLGLGIRPPEPSWGNLITTGQTYMTTRPNLLLEPALCIFLTVLNLNLLGDGLRRRFSLAR